MKQTLRATIGLIAVSLLLAALTATMAAPLHG